MKSAVAVATTMMNDDYKERAIWCWSSAAVVED